MGDLQAILHASGGGERGESKEARGRTSVARGCFFTFAPKCLSPPCSQRHVDERRQGGEVHGTDERSSPAAVQSTRRITQDKERGGDRRQRGGEEGDEEGARGGGSSISIKSRTFLGSPKFGW